MLSANYPSPPEQDIAFCGSQLFNVLLLGKGYERERDREI